MIDYVATFIFFFAVIDPSDTVPVFVAVTRHHSDAERRAIAIRAAAVSALIMVFFVVAGEVIFSAMEIPLPAFQVGGGIVLFLFALSMIFGDSKPEDEMKMASAGADTAVFPLAVPSIASPGAMLAAVLVTENSRYGLVEQTLTAGVMLVVLLVALVFMLSAGALHRLIGDSGASVVSRVMGMILASVASANVLAGIQAYFDL
ncbi:MAG: MarC family protein [Myxococcota bacterium]|nr:MarC family protein [Myxococcota bacterium]